LSSDVFIRRPILASVCSLLIILAGAISITWAASPLRGSLPRIQVPR